jgi:hypothetical protein
MHDTHTHNGRWSTHTYYSAGIIAISDNGAARHALIPITYFNAQLNSLNTPSAVLSLAFLPFNSISLYRFFHVNTHTQKMHPANKTQTCIQLIVLDSLSLCNGHAEVLYVVRLCNLIFVVLCFSLAAFCEK